MNEDQQVYDRDDICERISKQIQHMSGKELVEFCVANFGGVDHQYNSGDDTVTFNLE